MGLFGNNHIKSVATGNTNAFSNLVSGLQRMWTRAPSRDRMQLPDLAHKSPRLDPIFIIGRAIAGTEWNLYNKLDLKKNGKTAEPIINTDIIDLFDYPIRRYPEIDWYALCYSTVCVVKAVGEYAWLKVRDEKGKVFEIDPIPPGWIMRTPTAGDPYYTIYPFGVTAGKALIVSPDDIVYFKKSDLNDPFSRGRGDSEQLEDEFEVDEYASKSQKNLFFNDATPPYIITAPGMPQDQADGFKKSWMQKLGGFGHKREPGVIGFDAKVLQLGMSPQEMDFVESRKFIREEVYQHYQIPPEIYGNIQNSNRATITSAEYLFHKNVLNTEYRFFERVITRQLIAMDFDKTLCFKFEDVVPDDEDFKLQVYNAGVTNGTITKNEWRKAFDLPPLKASVGDVLQTTFSTYTIPIDVTEISDPVKPENTTGQTEDKPTDDDMLDAEPLDEAGKAIYELLQKQKQVSVEKKKTIKIVDAQAKQKAEQVKARREAVWKAFDARATAKEGEFIQAVKKFSTSQKTRVISALKSPKLEDAINTKTAYASEIDALLKTVFTDQSDKALKSALAPAWLSSMESGKDHFYEMMGGKKSIAKADDTSVYNKLFNDWIEAYGLDKAIGINATTKDELKKKLQDVISQGISDGDTIEEIKNAILDACDECYYKLGVDTGMDDASRARLIARTESATSVVQGSRKVAGVEGMTQKQWLAQMDSRVRDDHANVDGVTIGIDEKFNVGGVLMDCPLDPECADVGEIANCRCDLIYGNADIPLD